ncbi:hypothetical protein [Aestuariivirga sp.]|uniref:hypothetical protein n=1 Tax=Aestuariivirga sp. TaxID=2650926 RepID=UPI00391C69E2
MTLTPEISRELRAMVRDVLRDAMAQRGQGGSAGAAAVETVRISSDQDLAAFVARLIDPATLDRVRTGRLRFTLGAAAGPAPSAAPAAALTGVITEQKIDRFRNAGRLVLAPDAVLTPLARDRARKLGLIIERRR